MTELEQYEYGKDVAAEGTIEQEACQIRLTRDHDERVIINVPADGSYVEILGHRIDGFESFKAFRDYLVKCAELENENKVLKHRLDIADEYIESRKKNMIVDHYDDLKYILNECDLESTW